MHYSSLPEHYRRAIDSIHDAMMKHKRTMSQIKTMRPSGLVTEDSSLPAQVQKLQRETLGLENDLRKTREVVDAQGVHSETLLTQIFHFGIWPTEAVAVRRGVRLSEMVEEKKDDELQTRIRALLDGQMVHVERLERMPSPFLLQLMDTMQERADKLKTMLRKLEYEMNQSRDVNVHSILGLQHQQLHQVASKIVAIQQEMQKLRATYQVYERGENVIEKADREEFERKQREEDAILMHYLKAGQSNASQQQQTPGAPAPAFGASPAPATSFSFGSTTTTPAPAFGSTTTPTAPAPLGGGFSVSTPRTSSKKKGGSKSSDRLKR